MKQVSSQHSVSEVVSKIKAILDEKQIKCFTIFDHAREADQVGLSLPETQVIVFGDPKVGTFLMQQDNRVAIALPLKLLVWDNHGKTHIGYELPSLLGQNYALKKHQPILEKMDGLMDKLAHAAAA